MPLSQRELDHQYRMRKVQLYQYGVKVAGLVVCTFLVFGALYLCVRQLAGRHTLVDMAFKVLAELKANKPFALIVSWVLTTISAGWAISERGLKKRYIKRFHPGKREHQLQLDPKRGSSHLTEIGATNPEDI
jgi:hypothetical protein